MKTPEQWIAEKSTYGAATPEQSLADYINEQARVADANSKEWEAAGDKVQAAYRNGMWYAYNDIGNRVQQSDARSELPSNERKRSNENTDA